MDYQSLVERKRERFEQLEREIADPALFENRKRASEIMREHSSVKQLLALWNDLEIAREQLDQNRELAASNDVEIAASKSLICDIYVAVLNVMRFGDL